MQEKHLRDDGRSRKWGEWREEQLDKATTGETWEEWYTEHDDYWERRNERYNEYSKRGMEDAEGEAEAAKPKMLRSGITEFKNNRNYHDVEQWEEYQDGTLIKK